MSRVVHLSVQGPGCSGAAQPEVLNELRSLRGVSEIRADDVVFALNDERDLNEAIHAVSEWIIDSSRAFSLVIEGPIARTTLCNLRVDIIGDMIRDSFLAAVGQ